ncbi:hypothetical protein [Rhizobium sp. N324]|uniref:hypothetical protein n=1 Tax=Rhizobium sp. N324 TaxID=1703969 RepID=UPI00167DD678|nr:hypothetical protein [Rhizobium sp. N324]
MPREKLSGSPQIMTPAASLIFTADPFQLAHAANELPGIGGRGPPVRPDDLPDILVIPIIGEGYIPDEATRRLRSDIPITELLQAEQEQQMVGHDDQPRVSAKLIQRRTHGGIGVEAE